MKAFEFRLEKSHKVWGQVGATVVLNLDQVCGLWLDDGGGRLSFSRAELQLDVSRPVAERIAAAMKGPARKSKRK